MARQMKRESMPMITRFTSIEFSVEMRDGCGIKLKGKGINITVHTSFLPVVAVNDFFNMTPVSFT